MSEVEYLIRMVEAAKLEELDELEYEFADIESGIMLDPIDAYTLVQRLEEWLAERKRSLDNKEP